MSGIKYYPSRDQGKYQRVVQTTSNIAVTYNEIGTLYYCYAPGDVYISLSTTEDAKIPVGAQVDFLRLQGNVIFSPASGSIFYYSSAGTVPKIRIEQAACSFIKVANLEWAIVGDIVPS